jgi:hypothetical protein
MTMMVISKNNTDVIDQVIGSKAEASLGLEEENGCSDGVACGVAVVSVRIDSYVGDAVSDGVGEGMEGGATLGNELCPFRYQTTPRSPSIITTWS